MTTDIVPPTLSEMEAHLEHIAVSATTNSPSSSKGARKFDESAVKRDGGGRFSKQAALNALAKEHEVLRKKQNADLLKKFGLDASAGLTTGDIRKYVKTEGESKGKKLFDAIMLQAFEVSELQSKFEKDYPALTSEDTARVVMEGPDKKSAKHSDIDSQPNYLAAVLSDPRDLAHFGVKGMKWGVSRADGGGSSSRAQLANAARTAGKAARIAAPIALPAAAAGIASLGLALPAVPIAAGAASVAMKALNEPAVQAAIKTAGAWSKSVASEFGSVKLSDLPKPNLSSVANTLTKNPFSVRSTTNTSEVINTAEQDPVWIRRTTTS